MEGPTETSRAKHRMNWWLGKNDRGDNEVKENDYKSRIESNKKKEDETYVYCSRKNHRERPERSFANCCESSMVSIAASLNNNCCLCCGTIIRYIRAVISCLSCLVICQIPRMEFERLFCELIAACGGACFDIMCFIRKFLCVCFGTKD